MQMALHEAMVMVLTGNGGIMHGDDLAREIADRDLYRRQDGAHAAAHQLRARAVRYPDLLQASTDGSGRISLVNEVKLQTPPTLAVFCADVGSVKNGNFGWARDGGDHVDSHDASRPAALAAAVAAELTAGRPVALGFECPLFLPVPSEERRLGRARAGEGNRAWSAGAGSGALATGLVQAAWVLRAIQAVCPQSQLHLRWPALLASGQGLLIWEALVTGDAKAGTHVGDAAAAVAAFRAALPDLESQAAVTAEHPISVIGAAALWSGWVDDASVVHEMPVVVRAFSG